ncbi:MAG TPA: ATP phosphoribosyltransferase regulatory subunit [Candidatus Onthomonas avicola]|nr:ATP phosphoribosyltransferase regulatory subunit [Candidatus Onthomonas avicola]
MRYIPNTPEGTRDRLFEECRERRRVQSALTHLFRQRGYSEIITPEEEFYDLFTISGSAIAQEEMVKLVDRSGKICVLRPDCTTPIARVAATKLKDAVLPQRFYYNQAVYRAGQEHRGRHREIPQCGIELIGAKGRKADLEVIATAVDALRACALEDFHIELGHADIFPAFARRLEMDREELEQMRALIEGKNFTALDDFMSNYAGQPGCEAVRRLAYLFGGVEVLDEAEALAGRMSAIDYLRDLYTQLDRAGYGSYLRFDLGMVHHIDYYTGPIFRGYVEGAGDAVLSGGRYDQLCASFGRPAQATGFAIDVDGVARCLPQAEPPRLAAVVHYPPHLIGKALALVDSRARGTCELSPCNRLESTLQLAREKGIGTVLILEEDGIREVTVS